MKVMIALFALSLVSIAQSIGAITVTEITEEEYTTSLTENPVSLEATFRAGGISGQVSDEVELKVNDRFLGQHTWDYPDDVGLSVDGLGNVAVTINTSPVTLTGSSNDPVVNGPFNTIYLWLYDNGTIFGNTSFTGGLINGVPVVDLSVDEGSRYVRIDLGEQNPEINLSGSFASDPLSASANGATLKFTGVQTTNIPETGSTIFLFATVLTSLLVRKRVS